MTDEELARSVAAELAWDPRVGADAIDVTAGGGSVTLRGAVGTLRQKREAHRAAQRVHGVTYVQNDLDVRIMPESRRPDDELRIDVLRALRLDILVPGTVDAGVTGGVVLLSGTADWQYQRDEAVFVAGNVRGVIGLENDIYLTTPVPYAAEVRAGITRAFERDAKIDAGNVGVATLNGTAVLTGLVRSWAEHDAAVEAAWAAPGVSNVDDRLQVTYH